ncbi:MAG: two-component system histidine kinase PnpS [Bacillota bacterium]
MPFHSIRWRLTALHLMIITVSLLTIGGYLIWRIESFYMSVLEKQILNEALIAGELINNILKEENSEQLIDDTCKIIGSKTGHRITYLAPDGRVIGDSLEKVHLMDNHLSRPEIQAALREGKGSSQRYSSTLAMEMYYLALAIESDGEAEGFVRLAVPLSFIRSSIGQLRIILISGLFLALFISSLLSLRFSGRLTRPLEEVGRVARGIASGNFSKRVEYQREDELGVLARTVNEMGETLKENVEKIVYEKNRLETVMSAMTSGVILCNDKGEIDFINDAGEVIFGLDKGKATGLSINKAFRNYLLYDQFQEALAGGEIKSFDLNLFFPETKVLQVHMIPIRDHSGKTTGVLAVLHDITGLRSLERMRSEFAANVSHELRTPLTTIKGYAETLLDETNWQERETALHFLRIIDKEAERLSHLLDDLLNLARIESNKGVMKKQKVSVKQTLEDAVSLLKKQAGNKNLEVKLETGQKEWSIQGDHDWLLQLFIDLLDNAIKYTPEGGKIVITIEEKENECIVAVSDTGIGISGEDLPHIFERFYRADKARSRRLGGTGLGLAVVKHIVEAHNARINVKSTVGQGTTFTLSFPI